MMLLTPLLILALVAADGPTPPQAPAPEPAATVWNLSLPEAIRIGLINSEVVRVVATGTKGALPAGYTTQGPVPSIFWDAPPGSSNEVAPTAVGPDNADIVISRLNADASVWNFKAAILAHVRSIEQQYWALSFQSVNLWSRETAVRLGEEILKQQRAELERGRSTTADIAEAEQQLDNFKLNLVTATSDLITTERQLRTILGLSKSDNRRIVPTTEPTEAEVKPVWETIVKQMLAQQPDVVQQRELLSGIDLKEALDLINHTLTDEQRAKNQYQRDRQRMFLQQIIQQAQHSLARFFLEVDASFKQFQTAQRLKTAATQRLAAQKAFNEEGRITIDRLLDAVSQYANAVSQEAQHRATYNTTIAALEEAKGTLLASEGVTVVLEPASRKHDLPGKTPTPTPEPITSNSTPAATNYKVRASIGGMKLIDVEVEVNQPNPK